MRILIDPTLPTSTTSRPDPKSGEVLTGDCSLQVTPIHNRILTSLREHGPLTTRSIHEFVKGRSQSISDSLDDLVAANLIEKKVGGPRGRIVYRIFDNPVAASTSRNDATEEVAVKPVEHLKQAQFTADEIASIVGCFQMLERWNRRYDVVKTQKNEVIGQP